MPSNAPAPSAAAASLFGPRLDLATRYVELLASTGIEHGLLGPAERPRLWDRHVLNCAVVAPAFRPGSDVIDVGSGAGLPGIVVAILRPDLQLTLVEPLKRRTVWLHHAVAELALPNVSVHRGRAESLWSHAHATHVTARAVARLATLAGWCLPLLESGGSLLAIKGEVAQSELDSDRDELVRLGATDLCLQRFGIGLIDPPTVVVRVSVRDRVTRANERPRRARSASSSARRTAVRGRDTSTDRSAR